MSSVWINIGKAGSELSKYSTHHDVAPVATLASKVVIPTLISPSELQFGDGYGSGVGLSRIKPQSWGSIAHTGVTQLILNPISVGQPLLSVIIAFQSP